MSEQTGESVDLNQFFWNSVDLLCVAKPNGEFVRVNEAFARCLGYQISDLEGQSFFDFVHPDDHQSTKVEVAKLNDGVDTAFFQNRYLARDQTWKWLAWTCPAPTDDNQLLYACARDITLQKQTLDALQFRDSVFGSMQHGLLITDVQQSNKIIYANSAFEKLTGYTEAEILNKNCRFLQNHDSRQPQMTTLRSAIKNGTACRVLLRNYRRDGSLFWNELTLSPIRDAIGQLTYFVGIQNNVTDVVKAKTEKWQDLETRIAELAPRQKQVMAGILRGQNIKQIALELDISSKTAEVHRTRVVQKMRLSDVFDLVRTIISSAPSGYAFEGLLEQ
jgi:PAS domain S-box-containing protein